MDHVDVDRRYDTPLLMAQMEVPFMWVIMAFPDATSEIGSSLVSITAYLHNPVYLNESGSERRYVAHRVEHTVMIPPKI